MGLPIRPVRSEGEPPCPSPLQKVLSPSVKRGQVKGKDAMEGPLVYEYWKQPRNASRCLRVAVNDFPGLATLLPSPDGVRGVGPMVSLLEMVAASLSTCVVFLVPEDRFFGVQLPNGTWNGIIGMLERQTVDMTALALNMGQGREVVVDNGEWVYQDSRSLTYKYPVPEADIAGFVKPFKMQVWGVFLVTLLAVWLCLLATHTLLTNDGCQTDGYSLEIPRAQAVHTNLWDSFLWAYGHPLAQPSAWWPRGSVRWLAGVWLLLTLVLNTIYRSNLKAMLILPHLPLPFNTMEELIASGIPCFVVPDTALYGKIMRADPKSQYGRLRRNLVVHINSTKATQEITQGKYAGFASHVSALYAIHNIFKNTSSCPVYMASESLEKDWKFFLYPKNSTLREKVDVIIRSLRESGILEKLLQEQYQHASHCLKARNKGVSSSKMRALEFTDFHGVFLLYCGGITLAGVTLLVELLLLRLLSPRTAACGPRPDSQPTHARSQ